MSQHPLRTSANGRCLAFAATARKDTYMHSCAVSRLFEPAIVLAYWERENTKRSEPATVYGDRELGHLHN